jgi:glycosyltransferase involved in cell wall biosynthesis
VLRARRHDILHCHTFAFALGGSVASYILKRPLVVTVHSSHFLRLSRNAVMSGVMRALLAKACCLMSTSKEIDMVVRGLLPDHFTQPIVNGIDTEKFRPAQPVLEKDADEFLIVCPRRLVEKNGVEFLIRALAVVRDVKARLYIAGDGPLRGRLEALAAEIGVRDRVVFMGSVDNTKMPSVYSSADLVVIPSLLEATSIAALEAMACAKVVAASRVGGLPEIIDDRVGILFEPGSARAIAGAIQNIAARPDTAGMGREARRRVEENWGIGRIAEIHEELYEKVIKESADA